MMGRLVRKRAPLSWAVTRLAGAVFQASRNAKSSGFFRTFGSKLAVQGRYNQKPFHRVLSRSLQGIAERPLPCNYNVIQFLSRR